MDRRSLHRNHKLHTADLSQVCDGRNWETFRDAAEASGDASAKAEEKGAADDNDATEEEEGPPVWEPAAAGEARAGAIQEKAKTRINMSYKPKSSRLSEHETGGHQDSERHQQKTLEEVSTAVDGQGQGIEGQPRQEGEKSQTASAPTDKAAKGSSDQGSPPSRRQRRRGSSDSTGSQRRHSDEKAPDRDRLPRAKDLRRRLSVDGQPPPGSRVAVRKLSEPMHRCTMTNSSVSGIMRPARYSSNNLVALANGSATSSVASRQGSAQGGVPAEAAGGRGGSGTLASMPLSAPQGTLRPSRYFSSNNLAAMARAPQARGDQPGSGEALRRFVDAFNARNSGQSGQSDPSAEIGPVPTRFPGRSLSTDMLAGYSETGNSIAPQDSSNANWVASGVDFSKSMEVYLFKT